MAELLQRMCQIISKTGEKFIFSDLSTKDEYVILKLQNYEAMIDTLTAPQGASGKTKDILSEQQSLTGSPFLDKINSEIALLKEQAVEHQATDTKQALDAEAKAQKIQDEKDSAPYYFEPLE